MFSCRGELLLETGTGKKAERILKGGEFVVVNSTETHAVNTLEKGEEANNLVLMLQMGRQFIRNLYADIDAIRFADFSLENPQTKKVCTDEVRNLLFNIMNEQLSDNDNKLSIIHGLCGAVVAHLIRYFRGAVLPVSGKKDDYERNSERFKRILTFVNEHYAKSPTLNETAEVACVSPFYLSHVFAQVMGIPYSQYLNYIKINMAYRDLASTGDSILDILLRHGFNNAKTFNKAFKSQIGCSPSEYRKEVRQGRRDRYIPYPRVEDKPGSYVNFKSPVVMPQTPYRAYSLQTGKTSCRSGSVQTITIDSPGRKDCGIKTTPLDRYYLKMIGHSRAGDLLRKGVQEHFILVQKEIGFEYIRFFGIFDDEMCIITKEGLYNWTYVDEVFDFLAEIGLRPFVNFSFMPSARRQVMQRYFTIREMLRPLPVGKNGGIWSNLSCGIA